MRKVIKENITKVVETEYAIGIHHEGNKLMVRKSKNIGGIFVPVDQEEKSSISAAIVTMQQWIDELHTSKSQERWN